MPKMQSRTSQENEVVEEHKEVQPEERIFTKEETQLFPPGRHIWRQQGPYIVCRGCELHHGIYVGMDNIMVGEDENGKPILRAR